jgi:Fe2+ transport system protein FeoA
VACHSQSEFSSSSVKSRSRRFPASRSLVTDVTAISLRECHYENENQFQMVRAIVEAGTDRSKPCKVAVTYLDRAPQRKCLEVVEVPQGRGVMRSLAQLGVFVSEKLRVRGAAPWSGPILVEVGGTTVAIGRCLARRIKVRLLRRDGTGDEPCPSR